MEIVMLQTITESLNEGRTKQTFLAGHRYDLPVPIGQIWIGRGWAKAASPAHPAPAPHERNGNGKE